MSKYGTNEHPRILNTVTKTKQNKFMRALVQIFDAINKTNNYSQSETPISIHIIG